jgi:nicotinamidase-related amidase
VAQSGPFIETVNGVIARAEADKIPVIYIRQVNTDHLQRLRLQHSRERHALDRDR